MTYLYVYICNEPCAERHYRSSYRQINMKILLLSAIFGLALAAPPKDSVLQLPSYVKTCARDRPDFNDCLKNALQDILPYVSAGIKSLDIPPFDPLYIEEGIYEFGGGTVTGRTSVKDVYTYGLKDSTFKTVRTNFDDPNNIVFEADFFTPVSRIEGTYKQHGKFLGAEIRGNGKMNITSEDVLTTMKLSGVLHAKNGEKFFKVKHFLFSPNPAKMHIDSSNLFNGNEVLSKAILDMANQYWRPAYDEMLPHTQQVWDKVFREIANRLFLRIPFDTIFPPTSA